LRIKSLALIEEMNWTPGKGFNTLSGETGAGKSILIDGLMLLAGERADKSLIRTGANACSVEGEIFLPRTIAPGVAQILAEIGAEPCEDSALLLKRTLQSNGANKQFVNGSPVTLQALKRLGDLLVDLHGPHDHQSLLSVEKQLEVLDAFGQTEALRGRFADIFDQCIALEKERDSLQLNERERAEKIERLTRHVRDIQDSQIQPDEDLQVERDFRLANNSRQLIEHASTVTNLINDAEINALSIVAQIERQLILWQKIDPEITELMDLSHSAATNLQELASNVQSYAERIDLDPGQLQKLEQRLDLLNGLKRKYGPTLSNVIAHGENCARELQAITSGEATLQEVERKLTAALSERKKCGQQLTASRLKVATPLAAKVQDELRELGFNKARFQIEILPLTPPLRSGFDQVEFIFAPNLGESPQPLRNIASSGEMARVMLAVKTTLAEVDQIPVLVFDEVDANIGGETAWQVGSKLRKLGKSHQVLCITHLPQVASQGDMHFSISKEINGNRTTTQLQELDLNSRAKEIARMLGGENKESLALAQKMMKAGREKIESRE